MKLLSRLNLASSRYRSGFCTIECLKRRSLFLQRPLSFLLYLPIVLATVVSHAAAQDKTPISPARPSSCSRDNALSIIQRQIDLSKTIDQDERRLNVLLKAADLTWPLEQDKARASFSDAFEGATRQFRDKGENDGSKRRMKVQGIDYRYTLITSIS